MNELNILSANIGKGRVKKPFRECQEDRHDTEETRRQAIHSGEGREGRVIGRLSGLCYNGEGDERCRHSRSIQIKGQDQESHSDNEIVSRSGSGLSFDRGACTRPCLCSCTRAPVTFCHGAETEGGRHRHDCGIGTLGTGEAPGRRTHREAR